jgi:mannosyl-glycoprotein endo-beta-N-acetylglucosaminidase
MRIAAWGFFMKNIAKFLVALIIFSIIAPSQYAFAASNGDPSEINETEVVQDQQESTINEKIQSSENEEGKTETGSETDETVQVNNTTEEADEEQIDTKPAEENSGDKKDANSNSAGTETVQVEEQPDVVDSSDSKDKDNVIKEEPALKQSSLQVDEIVKSETSRLGHIKENALIYPTLDNMLKTVPANEGYLGAVYYIKQQAVIGDNKYYLLSTKPSSTSGLVGWVKSSDVDSKVHETVDADSKKYYVAGTGKAYTKAWGDNEDVVYDNLSNHKLQLLEVDLTETVGDQLWYRGTLAGKKVFIKADDVLKARNDTTSRLGHLNSTTKIYQDWSNQDSYVLAGEKDYTGTVYYIKKKVYIGDDLFFLISTKPSSTSGIIGWVKSTDLSSKTHFTVDNSVKTFYISGESKAFSKAWGDQKDVVYKNIDNYKLQEFKVDLTETVGGETWYRGILSGEKVFVKAASVATKTSAKTSRLGHLHDTTKIYEDLNNLKTYKTAKNEGYTDNVYYIKKQVSYGEDLYYLISTKPSDKEGIVGWVEASKIDSESHVTVDAQDKTLYIKGTGKAYSKAWGDTGDVVYEDLSKYELDIFKVNLTESVGDTTWYRGMLNNKEVFIPSEDVTAVNATATSRLGHLKSTAKIYQSIDNLSDYNVATTEITSIVYYIKEQAVLDGNTYYLLSKEPSSTTGLVGWVRSSDIDTETHVTVDSNSKIYHITGDGQAYSKAWGNKGDIVFSDLGELKYHTFEVDLTEKVGNETWYRGMLDGKKVFVNSENIAKVREDSTSRLGKLKSSAKIYEEWSDQSSYFVAENKGYTEKTFYIKQKVYVADDLYFLISTQPSNKEGVIGWIKSTDMTSKTHFTVDNNSKSYYIAGTGEAYSKAWGSSADTVYNLSDYKYQKLNVDLTETVGGETWYRGTLEGKKVFVKEGDVLKAREDTTSRLGLLHTNAKVFPDWSKQSSYVIADDKGYVDTVYYIKEKVYVGDDLFFLISTKPSSTEGVIGWVLSTDMDSKTHVTIDNDKKTYFVNGSGVSYDKAWGGVKDTIFSNLSSYAGEVFKVDLTEKVGSTIWFRGIVEGQRMWLEEKDVTLSYHKQTSYNLSLNEALNIQLGASPQTDKEYATYVSSGYINSKNEVTASSLNVRGGPSTDYWIVGTLSKGTKVEILGHSGNWYKIAYTGSRQWVNPDPEDLLFYLDPNNFINNTVQKFQFLDLSRGSGVTASTLNDYLKGKGSLAGQGKAFIDASDLYGINDIYLVSHAILETGNGSSSLAQGVEYKGKTVYNMYGFGAYDSCPIECGAKKAYEEGWFTPYKAIVGGADIIASNYISKGQNTLYQMRWNPEAMSKTGSFSHQYATDIGWAYKQVYTMYNLYNDIGSYTLYLDIPSYK